MEVKLAQITALRSSLLDDLFKDFDSQRRNWVRRLLQPVVWPSANRFANIAATFDYYVERFGFREGMSRILPYFVSDVEVSGAERVPEDGPLLVISNHPGTYDSIAIAASLPRNDLNIIATGFPLLRGLPSASQHFIFASNDIHERMAAVRSSIRHLRSGGSLLIFPGGRVEPDPAALSGAPEAIDKWSPSLELFLRQVPQTQVLITIVSDVFAPIFLKNPLIRFWQGIRDPQAVAEVFQVATQMIFPGKVQPKPRISFGIPAGIEELVRGDKSPGSVLRTIIDNAKQLLAEHIT